MKKTLKIATLVLAALCMTGVLYAIDLETYLNHTITDHEENKYDEVLRFSELIVENRDQVEHEKMASVFFLRGYAYNQLHLWEQGIESWTEVISLGGDSSLVAKAYFNRGYCYENLLENEKALADYREAVERNPLDVDAYRQIIGIYQYYIPDTLKALAYAKEALINNPSARDLYGTLAELELKLEYYAEAEEHFTMAIDSGLAWHPLDEYYRGRGVCRIQLGNYISALKDYDMAISLTENPDFFKERGDIHYEMGSYEIAVDDYTSAIDLRDWEHVDDYYGRASAYTALQRYFEALMDYRIIEELEPCNPEVKSDMGKLYQAAEMHWKAVEAFSEALVMKFPETIYWCEELYLRAFSYAMAGSYSEALDDLSLLIDLDDSYYEPFYLRGQIYRLHGEFEKAAADYRNMAEVIFAYYDDPALLDEAQEALAAAEEMESGL